ncbi:NB-ARC domain-containing protein [Streptomyces purpureus]|uniref:NB-ARC domain-containing protein n=1 Tax=Streptomyces purpureus TaxID=1951 RepID=UPI0037906B10
MAGQTEASGDGAVAVGGNAGRINTGDHVTQVERATLLPAEALAPSECPAGLVHIPLRTDTFVGRERELSLLDAALGDGTGGVVVQAVHGLGGIGKSTLAARWAATRAADHNPVWWITAETTAELDAGLAALAVAMQPALSGVLSQEALKERALQWLATHDDWLLILDNVTDPADVRPLLARATRGRFLVTTRRASGWQGIARTVALDVLSPSEAVELFTRIRGGGEAGAVEELCAELGFLPLAVEQAAAYCAEAGITPGAYLDLLARYPAEVFAGTAEGGDASRAVARVWSVSLDRLADTPLAEKILRIIAWWSPEGIPRRFLDPLGTPLEVTEAVRRLAAHSLITLRDGEIAVHRLVQAVARTSGEGVEEARERALLLLARAANPGQGVETARAMAVQAEAFASHTRAEDDSANMAMLFRFATAQFGMDLAYDRALPLAARAAESMLRLCGPDDELTVSSFDDIANLLALSGHTREAVRACEANLSTHVRVLGPDHRRTLAAREQLADTLPPEEHELAVRLREENVERALRVRGARHPETIAARLALAEASWEGAGDLGEAEQFLRDAMNAEPPDEFLVRRIRDMMVWQLLEAGAGEQALALAERVAEESRVRDGDTNAMTLTDRAAFVHLLRKLGHEDRARALWPALLADCERALGESELTRLVRRLMD